MPARSSCMEYNAGIFFFFFITYRLADKKKNGLEPSWNGGSCRILFASIRLEQYLWRVVFLFILPAVLCTTLQAFFFFFFFYVMPSSPCILPWLLLLSFLCVCIYLYVFAREWLDIEPSFSSWCSRTRRRMESKRQLGDARLQRENPERRRYRSMEVDRWNKKKNPSVGGKKKKSRARSHFFFFLSPNPFSHLFFVRPAFHVITSFIDAERTPWAS